MDTELAAAIAANPDSASLAAFGIGIAAAVYLFGKRIVGALTKVAFLAAAVVAAQMFVVKDWNSDDLLNTARGLAGKVMTEQMMCDFHIIPSEAEDLFCDRPSSTDRSTAEADKS